MKRFTTVDGIGIAYDEMGEGPAVLMHHGFASNSATNWIHPGLAAAVADLGRRVIVIDARGHGESDKPHDPAAYAGGVMARDVSALFDELQVHEADIVGYSMGSFVALSLVQGEPRVRSLVLGGAGLAEATMWRPEHQRRIAEALEAPGREGIVDARALAFRKFAEATGADRLALAAVMRAGDPPPDLQAIRTISVPTLVVNGEQDTLVGSPASLAELIPGASFQSVPGDHLSAVVKPEFRQAIIRFLGSC
jgi:pimeloyl-ACP methyl ester carboxylesterase